MTTHNRIAVRIAIYGAAAGQSDCVTPTPQPVYTAIATRIAIRITTYIAIYAIRKPAQDATPKA